MIRSFFLGILSILILSGCADEKAIPEEILNQPVQLEIKRFDREFAQTDVNSLPDLKARYPYFFPPQYSDSIWLAKLQDTIQVELRQAVDSAYADFGEEEEELTLLFKHVAYYFPQYPIPDLITLTTDVDYENRIILTDSLLLIGLDNYLGKDHRFYAGIDRYIAKGLDSQYLESDIASALAKKVVPFPDDRSFLAQMIYYGKELYLKDLLLSWQTDGQKIGYEEEELAWARANEEQIWRYFVERELLYSTDSKLAPRFLDPAPFSKFRLELDNESPGRLGRYIGWQIVRAFMERTDTPVNRLWTTPAEIVFKESNYKPQK
ncbi:protein involved in gliding motility GldB [Muriicola jejuensis]|uniref:Gliding motility lipoprotein GldB n=1 Tax=Muriicola jejuensis TaxID=504488 RepID=A0A6P0UCJ4_9FLAO|nr:gliding motility lipoprotein GldB [Muriicola jejuensis]NER09348.1 gliding motility lipoprotein GldB [Muriicola jejuensis]SMP09225.1 protein involved in gliding motility GldB [Muriicola jejuensis]